MDELTRVRGSIRENAMGWALQTAASGERAEEVLSRARAYANWVGELTEAGLAPALGSEKSLDGG